MIYYFLLSEDIVSDLVTQVEGLGISSIEKLIKEAAQGHIDVIRDFITQNPDQVWHSTLQWFW